ncbi:hypothetical protein LEMLEM_LOCUS27296 [Lemmus lemmus]
MIPAASPHTHRRRHGDGGCSRAPSAVGATATDAPFTRPQKGGGEGAKGDALAASSKPTRPIASAGTCPFCPRTGRRASERIWLRASADSTPGRRLEVGLGDINGLKFISTVKFYCISGPQDLRPRRRSRQPGRLPPYLRLPLRTRSNEADTSLRVQGGSEPPGPAGSFPRPVRGGGAPSPTQSAERLFQPVSCPFSAYRLHPRIPDIL